MNKKEKAEVKKKRTIHANKQYTYITNNNCNISIYV